MIMDNLEILFDEQDADQTVDSTIASTAEKSNNPIDYAQDNPLLAGSVLLAVVVGGLIFSKVNRRL